VRSSETRVRLVTGDVGALAPRRGRGERTTPVQCRGAGQRQQAPATLEYFAIGQSALVADDTAPYFRVVPVGARRCNGDRNTEPSISTLPRNSEQRCVPEGDGGDRWWKARAARGGRRP